MSPIKSPRFNARSPLSLCSPMSSRAHACARSSPLALALAHAHHGSPRNPPGRSDSCSHFSPVHGRNMNIIGAGSRGEGYSRFADKTRLFVRPPHAVRFALRENRDTPRRQALADHLSLWHRSSTSCAHRCVRNYVYVRVRAGCKFFTFRNYTPAANVPPI